MIEIENSIVKVPKSEAMSKIKPKVDGYRSHHARIYVGVTNDPARRAKEHEKNGWIRMILLYEAWSAEIARELEMDIIDYCRRCNFKIPIENKSDGGDWIN